MLLAGDEETYRLIEAMLRRCRACYRTKKIHLGMDEAMNLGLGGYLKKNGYHESFDIMLRHVAVSYTHLDVYKRQIKYLILKKDTNK